MGDYLITEAGFGADMGAERFFNIKCRASGLAPDAAVLVATVRGLKAHSGNHKIVAGKPLPEDLLKENPDEVHQGGDNLRKQLENMRIHGCTPVVAINVFPGDHDADIEAIKEIAAEYDARAAVSTHFTDGGKGAIELAEAVADAAEEESDFEVLYPDDMSLRDKITTVARQVYGADGASFSPQANTQLDNYEANGFGNLPVCIAKSHLSLSHDPSLKGAPTGWTLPVREVRASVGAGFVYPICGDMRTMPGPRQDPGAAIDRHRRERRHRRPQLTATYPMAIKPATFPSASGSRRRSTSTARPAGHAASPPDDRRGEGRAHPDEVTRTGGVRTPARLVDLDDLLTREVDRGDARRVRTSARSRPPRHTRTSRRGWSAPPSTSLEIHARLRELGIREIFVVGGDADPPGLLLRRDRIPRRVPHARRRRRPRAATGRPHRVHRVPRHAPADHQRAAPRRAPSQAGDDPGERPHRTCVDPDVLLRRSDPRLVAQRTCGRSDRSRSTSAYPA